MCKYIAKYTYKKTDLVAVLIHTIAIYTYVYYINVILTVIRLTRHSPVISLQKYYIFKVNTLKITNSSTHIYVVSYVL